MQKVGKTQSKGQHAHGEAHIQTTSSYGGLFCYQLYLSKVPGLRRGLSGCGLLACSLAVLPTASVAEPSRSWPEGPSGGATNVWSCTEVVSCCKAATRNAGAALRTCSIERELGCRERGVVKGGVYKRKRTQTNARKRRQTQISGSLKWVSKRRQMRANAIKRR